VLDHKNKIINRTLEKNTTEQEQAMIPLQWYGIKTLFHLHATVMCYTQVDLLWPPRTGKYKLGIQGFFQLHYEISIVSMGPIRCCSKVIPHCLFYLCGY